MSTIDKIMGAIGRHGDDCIRDSDAASESFEGLREMIAAALVDARREGAEEMRAEAAKLAREVPLYYGSGDDGADESLAQAIEDLPLPTGPSQAVRHVGDSRFESWFSERPWSASTTKQHCRDAYAAGMGDPAAERQAVLLTDEQLAAALPWSWFADLIGEFSLHQVMAACRSTQAAALAANGLEVRRG